MKICEHKKNGRIRIFKTLTAQEALNEMRKAEWPVKPFLKDYEDVLYADLNEEQKKEYESKECWYCTKNSELAQAAISSKTGNSPTQKDDSRTKTKTKT